MSDRLDVFFDELAERVAARVIERLGERATAPTSVAPLLSKQQLAAQLGISPAGVDRLVRDAKIPFVRVGDVKRFDFAAVRSALEVAQAPASSVDVVREAPVRLLSRGAR